MLETDTSVRGQIINTQQVVQLPLNGRNYSNVATRSGTNQLHGTAYEFLRSTDLNALGHIFGLSPATFQKPTLQRNQFGLTIGGPIITKWVFFFTDYEGYRQLQKGPKREGSYPPRR